MSDPAHLLRDLAPAREFFVGIDSDGCAFDTMEIKHKECFIPNIINHWDLQAVSKFAREAAEFVNLYSINRGVNRFPGLTMVFDLLAARPEVVRRGVTPPEVPALRAWIQRETRLGNPALQAEAPKGPVKAVIFTHSHIDHVGGATVWAEDGVPIWATAVLPGHLLKQYALYLPIETIRGSRQFGRNVPLSKVPCSALGPRPDFDRMGESGMLLPSETFSGQKVLTIGGLTIELIEAHGETHDQLFVWIPEDDTVIAGDNFYWSFPNLYTLRGTSPRPVDDWIESVDKIRRRNPAHLVPNHTQPIHGKEKIAEILTNYRDSIQWVRDEVVRGANKGLDLDTLAETIKLPKHLAEKHYNKEFYGQVDWSVRAIYTNNLGWFDGRADKLYPLPRQEVAAREVGLLGGVDKVMSLADEAVEGGELRWAIHLLAKVEDSGLARGATASRLIERLALCYEGLAEGIYNTNGRAYLLQTAVELRRGDSETERALPPEGLVVRIPLEHIFFIDVATAALAIGLLVLLGLVTAAAAGQKRAEVNPAPSDTVSFTSHTRKSTSCCHHR